MSASVHPVQRVARTRHQLGGLAVQAFDQLGIRSRIASIFRFRAMVIGTHFCSATPSEAGQRRPQRQPEEPPAERAARPPEPHVDEHEEHRQRRPVDVQLQPALHRAERTGADAPADRIEAGSGRAARRSCRRSGPRSGRAATAGTTPARDRAPSTAAAAAESRAMQVSSASEPRLRSWSVREQRVDELVFLEGHTDRRAMRAHLHAGRALSPPQTQVALGRDAISLPGVGLSPRTIMMLSHGQRLTSSAPDAGVLVDRDFQRAERPRDGAGRAADHAHRIGALVARGRNTQIAELEPSRMKRGVPPWRRRSARTHSSQRVHVSRSMSRTLSPWMSPESIANCSGCAQRLAARMPRRLEPRGHRPHRRPSSPGTPTAPATCGRARASRARRVRARSARTARARRAAGRSRRPSRPCAGRWPPGCRCPS